MKNIRRKSLSLLLSLTVLMSTFLGLTPVNVWASSSILLFEDTFQNPQTTSQAWSINAGTWDAEWSLKANPTEAEKDALFYERKASEGYLTVGDTAWSDYTIETKVYMPTGDSWINLRGRVQADSSKYYQMGYNPGTKTISLQVGSQSLKDYPMTLNANQWYTFKMTFNGNRIEGYVDNQKIMSAVDNTYSSGKAGLRTNWGSMYVSEYRVKSIPENNVVLTSTGKTATSVALDWEDVVGATAYTVYRSTTPDSSYTEVYSGGASTYTDTSVTEGTIYYYKMTFTDGEESQFSNVVSVIPSASANAYTIALDAVTYTLAKGKTHAIKVTKTNEDSSIENVTTESTYISSDETIATVDAQGIVKAVNLGKTTITVTYDNKDYTINVTVAEDAILYYTFDEGSGSTVVDGTGNGHSATVKGGATWVSGGGIAFDGVDDYIELPQNILTGLDSITISAQVYVDTKAKYPAWIFNFGSSTDPNSNENANYLGFILNTDKFRVASTKTRWSGEKNTTVNSVYNKGVWQTITYTQTGQTGVIYVDGEKLGENSGMTYLPKDIINTYNFIGRAPYVGDPYFKGKISDFKIYNRALSSMEIKDIYSETEQSMFEKDCNTLSLGDVSAVTEDLVLPTKGEYGSTITWTSNKPEVIENNGIVHRPAADAQDVEVILTAILTKGIYTQTKQFPATVIKQLDEAGQVALKLKEDYNALELYNTDDVRGNLPLVREGANGSTIDWESSDTRIVTDNGQIGELYDGGIVNRPEANQTPANVQLTAKLSLNGQEMTKVFDVTVQPKPKNLDTEYTAGYLWTYFKETDYEKIYYGYSPDGANWTKLNKDQNDISQYILQNSSGTKGVRDPHLIRSAEGDKYWILGTDLHAEGTAPGKTWDQLNASQKLVVWESNDMVNWTESRLVFAGFPYAGCVWAPEAIYDEETGDYLVYWSGRDQRQNGTNDWALRVYVCRTRDFHTFTEPQVWLNEDNPSGGEVNIIDSSITKIGDYYYRFSTSDWLTVIDRCKTLSDSPYDVNNPNSSEWERVMARGKSAVAGLDSMEGITSYELPDGTICVMGDNSAYRGFTISKEDMESLNLTFKRLSSTFKDGNFRHGSVLRLSKAEEARILAAFGGDELVGPATRPASDENGLFFSEDFESTVDGNLTLKGNATVASGKLVLDGTSGSYAKLPAGWMDGLDQATISFDIKTELSSGNFFTFAIGQDSNKYMFFRARGNDFYTGITTSSYTAESKMAGTVSNAVSNWKNVILTFDDNKMKLYVDGKLVASNNTSATKLSDLGENVDILFGKSFYSGDAYFKGSYDNIKFYDRALGGVEIAAMNNTTPTLINGASVGIPAVSGEAGLDEHTTILSKLENNELISIIKAYSYDKETNTSTKVDITNIPLMLDLLEDRVALTIDGKSFKNGDTVDLSKNLSVVATYTYNSQEYTQEIVVKTPELAYNPVLPGQFADPDIDQFDGKYWIFPTTDGFSGWSGTTFYAFSSDSLEGPWHNEGPILEVNKDAVEAMNTVHNYTVPKSPWSIGSAWAPSIEKIGNKYYFFYCAKESSGSSSIGVAVADKPQGPYSAQTSPLITYSSSNTAGAKVGQAIDPSIFTDIDGKHYIYYGNGSAAVAELEVNDNGIVSIKSGTTRLLQGLTDFRESVIVLRIGDTYHFTWSCDDTGSENYRVNYGTSNSPYGPVTQKYLLLQKDKEKGMLGTAHQSMMQDADTGKYYISYHRFYMPLGIYTSGLGYHRETCINEVPYDEKSGLLLAIKPTMAGVTDDIILADGSVYAPKKVITGVASVEVGTEIGVAPVLPKTVKVTYSDNTTGNINVTWDAVLQEQYAIIGSFIVEGTVEGTELRARAEVTVSEKPVITPTITGLKTVQVTTMAGTKPQLPLQVEATYSDTTKAMVNVVWDTILAEKYAQAGTFVVEGMVEGTTLRARTEVTVKATSSGGGGSGSSGSSSSGGGTLP
ncbi:hypothetical protein CS063_17165, partial [Sporanaerobium hydrogeniformans]